jgi:GNAT superfamily N-acetyltransferase
MSSILNCQINSKTNTNKFMFERQSNNPKQPEDFSLGLVVLENGFPLTVGFIRVNQNVIGMVSAFCTRKGTGRQGLTSLGYGSMLLKEAETQIRQRGYDRVFLTSDAYNRPFYFKNGYRDMTLWDNFWYRNSYNMMKALI